MFTEKLMKIFYSKFRVELSMLDKKIIHHVKNSDWYSPENSINDWLNDTELLSLLESMVDLIFDNKKILKKIDKTLKITREDLRSMIINMISVTLPDPVFKSGPGNMTMNLVPTSLFLDNKKIVYLHKYIIPNYKDLDWVGLAAMYALDVKPRFDSMFGLATIDDYVS